MVTNMDIQNSKNALISVVIPVYKIEKYIGACIESIQKQTYENIEILVVNDGSPDNSAKIAQEYAKNDSRVKVIDKVNGGLSDARNAGIEKAKGEYILLVDGDDYIAENMIEKMYYAMLESGSDLCLCGIHLVDDKGQNVETDSFKAAVQPGIYTREQMYEKITNLPNWFYVIAWNKLYKREVFDKVKYPKGKIHEDEFVIHHVIETTQKTICLEDKLYYYVQRDQSIMHATFNIKRLDAVEAFLDRSRFFMNINKEYAVKMLKRARINFIDGYIALKKSGSIKKEDMLRLKKLHSVYKKTYKILLNEKLSVKDRITLGTLSFSLKLGTICSGNYWHTLKY